MMVEVLKWWQLIIAHTNHVVKKNWSSGAFLHCLIYLVVQLKRARCFRLKSMVFGGEWVFLLPLAFMFLLFNLEHSLFLMGKTKTFCNSLFRLGWGFPSRSSNGGTMDFKISPFGLKRSFSFCFTLGVAKAFYLLFKVARCLSVPQIYKFNG